MPLRNLRPKRRYSATFRAEFGEIDRAIAWIESHFTLSLRDRVGIIAFEALSNIIEHNFMRMTKMQLYSNAHTHRTNIESSAKFNIKSHSKRVQRHSITCHLHLCAKRAYISFIYPFKPCYHYSPCVPMLGGRGKTIISLMGANTHHSIKPRSKKASLILQIPMRG